MAERKWPSQFVVKKAEDPDPLPVFKFWVEMKSIVVAEFKECSGLRLERSVEPVEEGGVNDRVHQLPGRNKYSNIVLKYGVMQTDELWKWYQEGLLDGKVKRINFTILLRNVKGEVVKRWSVEDAFPVKWEGPSLNVEGNQVAIETLEIVHHGLKLSE